MSWRASWLYVPVVVLAACSAPSVVVPASEPVVEPSQTGPSLAITLVDESGSPLSEIYVGARGSYDTRPRVGGQTDEAGRVTLTWDEPGTRSIPWPSAWSDDEEELMQAWGFAGVPLTSLIDAQGQVVEVWDGKVSMKALEEAVWGLIASDQA